MVSVDAVLDLLHEERRRYALYYLDEQDDPVHVDELAEAVATMRSGDDPGDLPEARVAKCELKLDHSDLPKASDAEFVEYDREAGVVRLTDEPPAFEGILTVAEVLERPACVPGR